MLGALKTMRKKQLIAVEVSTKAQDSFNADIQSKMSGIVWRAGGCQSWYIHPVGGKNVTLWPGFTRQFRQQPPVTSTAALTN